MNPKLKKLLKLLGFLLIVVGGIEFGISYFHEERVKNIAIEELNALLNTEVTVQAIEFSLFRQFPKASIEFKDIEIFDNSGHDISPLKAKSIFLEFDPFDLLTGNFVIDEIQMHHAEIRLHRFSKDKDNFHFLQSDEGKESFQLLLDKVTVKQTSFVFQNHAHGEYISIDLNRATLSGKFTSQLFDMSVDVKSTLNSLTAGGFKIKQARPLTIDFKLHVDQEKNLVQIKKAHTKYGAILVGWDGTFAMSDKTNSLALEFRSQDSKLKDLRQMFSKAFEKKFDEFDVSGHLDLKGSIKGNVGAGIDPNIDLSFSLAEGTMKHKASNIDLEEIYFEGTYSNGEARSMQSSSINIDSVSLKAHYGISHGNMKITNFNHPELSLGINTQLDLSRLKNLIDNDSIELLEGVATLKIQSFLSIDSLSKITPENLRRAQTTGELQFDSVNFKHLLSDNRVENAKGSLKFGAGRIVLDSFKCNVGEIPLEMHGRLRNFLPFVFFDDEKLEVRASLKSDQLNLNSLVSSEEGDSGQLALPISKGVTMIFEFEANNFEVREFKASHVKAQLKYKHPMLLIQNLEVSAMEGTYNGWMQVESLNNGTEYSLKSELILEHVNIQTLFTQFENFGQEAISGTHLKGYANTLIDFQSVIDPKSGIVSEKTVVRAKVEILNGELIDYKPVLALSKYVDVEELQHIKFSKLENEIEIKDRMVYIPEMNVLSSALELKLSGKHSFDNEFVYHFELYMSDVLFKRAKRSKKNQKEFGEIQADESGRSKMHIRLEGNYDDYKIKLDRKAIRKNWNENIKNERKALNEIFKDEFGGEKKEKSISPMNFEIEWDDGNDDTDSSTSQEDVKLEKKNKDKPKVEDEKERKDGLLNKLGGKNEDEYESYDESKFD